jgi:glycosyltransferase involved in cell wall biosynthesis
MKNDPSAAQYAFCLVNRAGWKSIRLRLEKFLPQVVVGNWEFFHLEDYGRRIGALTKRLGKFQMIHDVFSGRAAAKAAIRSGATKIIFGTYHNCPWLPQKKGVRYFIFSDGTMRQLANLGYSQRGKDISRMAKFIYGRGVRRQAQAGHHFFCMSVWYAKALQAEHGVRPEQITIVPPSVDTNYWQPKIGERKPGPLRAVFIGADFKRKGGDVLMQVAALPEFSEVEWHLVTKSPPQNKTANVTCHTDFNSDAEGLRNLVQNSDVLVLPTRADCSSIAALEAAACGVPSIITHVGGISDLVANGVNGILLEQPTVEHLSAALRKYLASPALLAAHGRAAREKVVREFDVRVVLGKIQKTLTIVD